MSDLINREDAINGLYNINPSEDFLFIDAIVDMLENLPEKSEQKWISVNEALPKNHEDVLVYGIEAINNKYLYAIKCWDVDTWRPLSAPSVSWVAWQPLPEPWRGEQ